MREAAERLSSRQACGAPWGTQGSARTIAKICVGTVGGSLMKTKLGFHQLGLRRTFCFLLAMESM